MVQGVVQVPELSETPLGYMRAPSGNLIELFRRGTRCFSRTYEPLAGRDPDGQPKTDGDVDLTQQQAEEYRRIMASCGGVVTRERMRPHIVAEEERTA